MGGRGRVGLREKKEDEEGKEREWGTGGRIAGHQVRLDGEVDL